MHTQKRVMKMTSSFNTYFYSGVLYADKDPIYYVETKTSQDNIAQFVLVYRPKIIKSETGLISIDKDYRSVPAKSSYSGETKLSILAKNIKESKSKGKQRVYNPPLFVSMVDWGKDTFSGKEGLGFWEYTPNKIDLTAKSMTEGHKTGVFILMSDIKWNKPVMDPKDVLEFMLSERDEDSLNADK